LVIKYNFIYNCVKFFRWNNYIHNIKIKKMKKLLDLTDNCVKTLSKRAIDENTNFKLYAQAILEHEATSNSFEKTEVRGIKKNKNK
jgi:hypothetical protein